jgi:hypothetical protein
MWLSPKHYLIILYVTFFKAQTFDKIFEEFSNSAKKKILIYVSLYHFLFISLLFCLWISYNYIYLKNYSISILPNLVLIANGILIGVFIGIFLEMIIGISMIFFSGIILFIHITFFQDVIFILVQSSIIGVALGAVVTAVFIKGRFIFSHIVTINFGIAIGLLLGIIGYIFYGVYEGVIYFFIFSSIYFFILGRLFYYPIYFFLPISSKNHPIIWDENIGLPILGLAHYIRVQARKKREETIAFCEWLLFERPTQFKIISKGLCLIKLDIMKSFSNLNDIQECKERLYFIPKNLEIHNYYLDFFTLRIKELPEYQYNFFTFYSKNHQALAKISQDIALVKEEQNLSNQIRLLQNSRQNLINFQKELNFSRHSLAFEFDEIIKKWLNIVSQEIRQIEQTKGLPLPNPFITGKPVTQENEIFVGRQDIISQIQTEALKEQGKGSILFLGNRRTGKTSTLLNLQPYVVSNLKTFFFDCQSALVNSNEKNFCEFLAEKLLQTKILKKPPTLPQDLASLTKLLLLIQNELVQKQLFFLICLDEYERLSTKIKNGDLAGLPDSLRYWIQHLPNFIFLFAGSHEFSEIKNEVDWSDYLINLRTVRISFLDQESALKLVTQPIPIYHLQYDLDDLPEKLIMRLGCQPYLIQVTMWELTELLNQDNSRKIAYALDIEEAINRMMQSAQMHFDNFWHSENSEVEREVLLQLAQNQTVEIEQNRVVLKKLVRKEILKLEDNHYSFCIPVLKEWILENN